MVSKLINSIQTYIFLFFLSIYLITASGTIQSSDGLSMFLVTHSVVENRSVSIDTGRKDLVKQNETNGNYYSKYGLGQSVCVIPLYVVGKIISNFTSIPVLFLTKFTVSLYNSFITAATCLVLFLFCKKLENKNKTAILVSAIYGSSTVAWHYSQTFMSEPATTLLIISSVYFVYDYKKYSKRNIPLSGLFLGLAFLTRATSIIVVPCFLFYILLSYRSRKEEYKYKLLVNDLMLFATPISIAIMAFFYYNHVRFGSIFQTGYRGEGFSTNIFLGAYGLLFSTGKGLFVYNPVLILSAGGFYYFYKEKKSEAILFLLMILAHVLLYSKWYGWHAGMSWGGRFLLVIVPFLTIPLSYIIESKNRLLERSLIFLVVIGILFQFSSLFLSTSRQYYDLRSQFPDTYINKINFSIRYSPVLYQWEKIPKLIGNFLNESYASKLTDQAVAGRKFNDSDDKYILKNALALNVPNFWWVYAWLYGIPRWLILISLSILFSAVFFTGKNIYYHLVS